MQFLTKVLRPITTVYDGEAGRALLFALNFFLIYTAYYMIKPIRESLILSLEGGAEIKSYASALQAGGFLILVPLYSKLASKFSGRGIVIFVYLFAASTLLLFAVLGTIGFAHIGVVYFVWVGMFNLLIISQTWSLCTHVYTEEQGTRLFPLIAFGSTSGAVFGAAVLSATIRSIGIMAPMTGAAFLLVICCVIVSLATPKGSRVTKRIPESKTSLRRRIFGGFGLIFSNKYLTLVAFLVLLANFVNTNSEYMLGRLVEDWAKNLAATSVDGTSTKVIIGEFYANFFAWVNALVLITQLFIVSRVIKYFGATTGLLILPILALLSYATILIVPLLPVIRLLKISENTTDYSINHTSRELLFLPVSEEEKYKAKFAIDTHFWRLGDMCSGLSVAIIVGALALGITAFAGLNIVLAIIWIIVVRKIAVRHKALVATTDKD